MWAKHTPHCILRLYDTDTTEFKAYVLRVIRERARACTTNNAARNVSKKVAPAALNRAPSRKGAEHKKEKKEDSFFLKIY